MATASTAFAVADRVTGALARGFALTGGAVLLVLVAMTCISVGGRALIDIGLGPVQGDFEMLELGIGFAIFAFLPWTQYSGAHARVDLFAPAMGPSFSRVLNVVADLLMSGAAIVIAWRLWLGLMDKSAYGETTMILQLPVWQAYAAGFAGACGFVLTALFCVWRSVRELSAA